MPGRNYSGGGGFYHQNGTVARNFGHIVNSRDYPFPQKREVRENRERTLNSYLAEDENFPSFRAQLSRMGLQLRDIPADGNCLFRALGDQLEGHCRNHFKHRAEVVSYMKSHRHDFEPFVEDDVSFDEHVKALQKLGTHAGNDAIVAFAKLHNVNVIIHQLRGRPIQIQGPTNNSDVHQLHLSYHNGQHYSSVRRLDDNTESPAQVCLQYSQALPTDMRTNHRNEGHGAFAGVVSAKRGLADIEAGVALATNCRDMGRIRRVLLQHDYDVDASVTDLLQQMKLNSNGHQEESWHLLSQRTHTIDNEGLSSSAASSSCSSPNSNSSRIAGSVLKANGPSYANGKGHKVHFREDSLGSSSGYESLHSYPEGSDRPKVTPDQQHSHTTIKESKSRKIDKKKPPDVKGREKALEVRKNIQQAPGVRDVTVVGSHTGRVKRY